ncbi:cytochrome d ubiquinol oxidase subunit II [Streptomyces sp. YGL11-2]|uniref:cytochrome d ubiquinol oxidase subunit II n=1 Tax=Streptomyces sp. YGL11-2 TaxID=3414028 RepID=UPI003CEEF69C
MDVFWYALTGLLFVGYLALESLDFGVGMLFFLARTEPDRERMHRTVVPLFLANEVWLVAFVGLLFGALPFLEGELLHAVRLPVVMLVCAWILRDAALWFRTALPGAGWRRTWDVVLPVMSLVLAAGWGSVLAVLVRGLSTDGDGHAVATFADLVHPFSLACALVAVAASLRQGTLFVITKLPDDSATGARAGVLAQRLAWLLPALILVTAVMGAAVTDAPVAVAVIGILAAAAVYGSDRARVAGRAGQALSLGAAPLVALPVMIGLVNGTTVLAARSGEGALTLSRAIADSSTLALLSSIVLPALIAVALGQLWFWRVFPRASHQSL